MFLGMLIEDYATLVFVLGLVATLLGQTTIDYLVRRYNSQSFIVFSIAGVMLVSVVVMTIAGVKSIIADVEEGRAGFKEMC